MTQGLSDQNHHPQLDPFPDLLLQHHGKTLFAPMAQWQTKNQMPPVLLFTGQAGIGKRALALYLAQWLLCENSLINDTQEAPAPCKSCHSCKSLPTGNHTAFTEITPDEDTEALKIDQFRNLKATVGFGTYHHHTRVILIPQAERMTSQAANSMLKLLEETPRGWQFLLTTHDATLLLPTLVSRCQILKLKPLPTLEIQKMLAEQGVDSIRASICAELSQGSWDRALQLSQDDLWEKRKEVAKFLKDPHIHLNSLLDWATQKTSHFELLVDLLEQMNSDLLTWSSSQPPQPIETYTWKTPDIVDDLAAHARSQIQKQGSLRQAQSFWIKQAERLGQSRQETHLPLNRKILAQDVLFPWIHPGLQSETRRTHS